MALSKYRIWIGRRDGDEDYVTFKTAAELAKWLSGKWPTTYWGIEKYDNPFTLMKITENWLSKRFQKA